MPSASSLKINLLLQQGAALNQQQWHGIAAEVALQFGAQTSFLNFHPPFAQSDLLRIRRFKIGGIIGRFGRHDYAGYIPLLKIPAVSLYGGRQFCSIPQVGTDDRAIGAMAADHLVQPGIVSFGYFGLPNDRTSRSRWAGYCGRLRALHFRALRFRPEIERSPSKRYPLSRIIPWESSLYAWLESLPKPTAIFCIDDFRAYWVAGACARMGIRIPDDAAILGVGNNPGYVHAIYPHLSSIEIPFHQEGVIATQVLFQMIRGKPAPDRPILLPPSSVVVRASTDILRVDNPHVARALRFIRETKGIGIFVDDIALRSGACRKVLERLFRQHLQSTVLNELRKVMIDNAKEALRTTDASVEEIAERAGYSSLNHLARDFKSRTGMSPGFYRKSRAEGKR